MSIQTHHMAAIAKKAAFSPPDISGLIAWWDLSDGSEILDAGGSPAADDEAVKTVGDKSVSANDGVQSTAAQQALYRYAEVNSENALDFDGTDDNYSISAPPNHTEDFTIFAVGKLDQTGRQTTYLAGIVRYFNGSTGWCFGVDGNGEVKMMLEEAANTSIRLTSPTVADNTAGVYCCVWDGGTETGTLYLDNLSTSQSNWNPGGGWGTGTTIGRSYPSGAYYWQGPLCEVVIYDSELSSDDRTTVHDYLSAKWGI